MHAVPLVIDAVDCIVGTDEDHMRTHEHTFSPRFQETAVSVENDNGMLRPAESIDAVLGVNGDPGNLS